MIAQGFVLGTTPILLLGPVDADYDVLIVGVASGSPVFVGASNSITTSTGSGSFQLPVSVGSGNSPTKLRLKVGDSLYAVATASQGLYVFAQPC